MLIESVTVRGFRCFDSNGQTIDLDDFTCLVGPNASGKTAAMMALARMFSATEGQRRIIPSDFHLNTGEVLKSRSPRKLEIECHLGFPELAEPGTTGSDAVPEAFNQMIVDRPDGIPYCRVLLEATWTDDGTPVGDIEQSLSWILTNSEDRSVIDDGKIRRMLPGERSRVRVVYVPAARDPEHQIRTSATTSFGWLLDGLDLGATEQSLKDKMIELQEQITALPGIRTMNQQVQQAWSGLYNSRVANEIAFRAMEEDPSSLVRLIAPTFAPGEDGRSMTTSDLGDGLRSLFYISMSLGIFRIEKLLKTSAATVGFKSDISEKLPLLTIFAVEEPENHLSPQYLGRVVRELMNTATDPQAQVLISSHSPSILGRVEPDNVRYFLGHENTSSTIVKRIPLPTDKTDESFKYVREAIQGYPELYFARLIILGEGPSEEIVLRWLFKASGTPLDTHFISVVPLGGRHVNHFWRLLYGLGIPHLTLLDLDREKEGAGWGRVQYVRDQLVKMNLPIRTNLEFLDAHHKTRNLAEPAFNTLADHDTWDTKTLDSWLRFFAAKHGVFFSSPLDLDFALLEAFPAVYRGLVTPPKGPRMPDTSDPGYSDAVRRRVQQVLASDWSSAPADLGSTYTFTQHELFPWYKYLFIDGSKPVSHMRALSRISDEELVTGAPPVLKQLIERARTLLV